MAEMLSDEQQIGIVEAVKRIYASATYKRLEKEETKLWHYGPVALYQDVKGEYCGNI